MSDEIPEIKTHKSYSNYFVRTQNFSNRGPARRTAHEQLEGSAPVINPLFKHRLF